MAFISTASASAASESGADRPRPGADEASAPGTVPLCWPFPAGSQNHTDKAVKLKPYVPPKRRSLNQY